MKEKKKSDLAVLLEYAGNYKVLTFIGMGLSAVAMVLGMLPYICIWLVARDLIAVAPNWKEAVGIARYGWMSFGFAVAGTSEWVFHFCNPMTVALCLTFTGIIFKETCQPIHKRP